MAIVLTFILCHSYILAVKLYELLNSSSFNMEHYIFCSDLKRLHAPAYIYYLHAANDIFLVFNSSINFVIYCCVNEEFRYRLVRLLTLKGDGDTRGTRAWVTRTGGHH